MTLAAGNTDVDICARALVLLGLTPINSLAGNDDKVTTCRTLYPMVYSEVLSRYPWRFTLAKRRLARLSDVTDEMNTATAFQLPSDRLGGPRAVFTSGEVGANHHQRITTSIRTIFTRMIRASGSIIRPN